MATTAAEVEFHEICLLADGQGLYRSAWCQLADPGITSPLRAVVQEPFIRGADPGRELRTRRPGERRQAGCVEQLARRAVRSRGIILQDPGKSDDSRQGLGNLGNCLVTAPADVDRLFVLVPLLPPHRPSFASWSLRSSHGRTWAFWPQAVAASTTERARNRACRQAGDSRGLRVTNVSPRIGDS